MPAAEAFEMLVTVRGQNLYVPRAQVERLLEAMMTIHEVGQKCAQHDWNKTNIAAPFMAGVALGSLLGAGVKLKLSTSDEDA